MSEGERIYAAKAPFDKHSADLVLRSSDNVNFRVHKQVLSLVSDFFDSMLSVPQPTQAESQDLDVYSGLPLVRVTEKSWTLDRLLRFCYPTADPEFRTVAHIRPVLMAAAKYQMDEVISLSEKQLFLLEDSPLHVYALACEFNLENAAKAAAERCRARAMRPIHGTPGLDGVTAGQIYRLLQFCSQKPASKTAKASAQRTPSFKFASCVQRQSSVLSCSYAKSKANLLEFKPHAHADMVILSMDDKQFHVNRYIVSLAAPSFFDHHRPIAGPSSAGLPVYRFAENSEMTLILLRLMYPLPELGLTDIDVLGAVTAAAVKYNMPKVIETLKRRWTDQLETAPLRVYFTMMRYGWEREAERAAVLASYTKSDLYVPEMEQASGDAYLRFLFFRLSNRMVVFLLSKLLLPPGLHRDVAWDKTSLNPLYWRLDCEEYANNADRFVLDVMESVPKRGWQESCTHVLLALRPSNNRSSSTIRLDEDFLGKLVVFEQKVKRGLQYVKF
ncbi:uncharacterized protein B0H18DRAFT_542333 [Fomitopsis serialis]|uniref:uncharacterized protein n=1 Tax=Fomitopsis serialis TaxID=139415 RepID=UPI002007B0FC|nr:uncharacterized protein B0H18DRAFT_542333 [Neoantrodia serialis]KAH9921623.1 hypothetical protein B0H18DRAFT_542333 [Neoantrodia serialis]